MRKISIIALLLSALATLIVGCGDHRDLYDYSEPRLHIETTWQHSLGLPSMQDATVVLYRDGAMYKEFFSRPNGATTQVPRGHYDLIVMNGIIESENVTNLNHLYLRGTDRIETFEAYIAQGAPNKRLSRADDEYIASNEMEMFSFACTEAVVEGDRTYFKKYNNGDKTNPELTAVESGEKVKLVTRAATYRFQVTMNNILNPRSALSATASLRGFAGSVFLSTKHHKRPKVGFHATHHLNFTTPTRNRTRTDEHGQEIGTIQSPVFVSFGPPLPENLDDLATSGRYMIDPVFVLTDGTEHRLDAPIDITTQVNAAIARIYQHHDGQGDIAIEDNFFHIEITDRIELPKIKSGGGVVDVIGWDDDEVIMIWI